MKTHAPVSTLGFSLLEVVIALSTFIFAVVAVASLLPIGMRANFDTFGETSALSVLDLVAADLASTVGSGNSPRFKINPANNDTILFLNEAGELVPPTNQNARFRINARRINPSQQTDPRLMHLRAVWPANDNTPNASRVEIITAF